MSLFKKSFETSKRSSAEVTEFDSIGISISSPDKIRSWSFGEIRKPETIELLNLKKTGFFVEEFLVQQKITNVFVENTKG